MTAPYAASFAGAFVACWIVSRLVARFIFKKAQGITRVLAPNAVTLVVVTLLGGLGAANGGYPKFLSALAQYAPPVLLWIAIDATTHWVRVRRAASKAA